MPNLMRRILILSIIAPFPWTLAACSGAPAGEFPGSTSSAMDGMPMPDAGTDAAPAPDAGHGPTILQWKDGPKLSLARNHHVTFAHEGAHHDSVFVGGGFTDTDFTASVVRSDLHHGALGAWTDQPSLPTAVAGAGIVLDGSHVFVVSGFGYPIGTPTGNPTFEPYVFASTIGSDGNLAPWTRGPDLPKGLFHLQATRVGSDIYVTGGLVLTGDEMVMTATDSVYRATVDCEGTLSAFTTLAPLPHPRSHHSTFVRDGYLYMVAGLNGSPYDPNVPSLSDVVRARVLHDGKLGAWETVGALPVALATHSSFVAGDHLYVLGGVANNADTSAAIWRARFNGAGHLGAFEPVFAQLPRARSHVHQTPLLDGYILSAGGMDIDGMAVDQVDMGYWRMPSW